VPFSFSTEWFVIISSIIIPFKVLLSFEVSYLSVPFLCITFLTSCVKYVVVNQSQVPILGSATFIYNKLSKKDTVCTFISLSTNRKLMLKYKTEALIIPTEIK